jgi:diadenosine tetraphosphatase ApaH/serine/threonine PP2A family protein phosphatase
MTIQAEASQPTRRAKWLAALGFGPKRRASAPEGMRIYTVGDIHGCAAQLDRLHALIEADAASYDGEKVIVYLGDYVDRGPDSRGVIERLIGAVPKGLSPRYVKGNHDQAMLEFLAIPETYRAWRSYGAPETLMSYGVRPPLFDSSEKFEEARIALQAALPQAHLSFLRSLESAIVMGDYAFVHAGIRPGMTIEDQTDQDLLWIRDDFLNCNASHEKVVVHGHTPQSAPVRLHNRISLDTGVYATGILSCAVLEGAECRFIQAGRG